MIPQPPHPLSSRYTEVCRSGCHVLAREAAGTLTACQTALRCGKGPMMCLKVHPILNCDLGTCQLPDSLLSSTLPDVSLPKLASEATLSLASLFW